MADTILGTSEWRPGSPTHREAIRLLLGLADAGAITDHDDFLRGLAHQCVDLVPAIAATVLVTDATVRSIGYGAYPGWAQAERVLCLTGPVLEASRTGAAVEVLDLDSSSRWPSFPSLTRRYGINAVRALPIPLGEHRRGAIALLAKSADFSHAARERGALLAEAAGIGLRSWYALRGPRADQVRDVPAS
ncbi:GAF domain-containing protein [Amycolatopsis samaneae]|uniref:GAF domain-containing protein n=1 Tax=Amycolatopsis samaneae TaxID=664691 RepID=A0ABW5GR89_9PSEU